MADVATGALAGHAIDGKANHVQGDGHGACLNCQTPLIGSHCHRCGQPAHVHRTAGGLFHDIAHGVFHLEGRTWHTIPLLFWRPGELTRRYAQGERVKFVSPMALFLFSVFLMVASFGVFGGPIGSGVDGKGAIAMAQARTEAAEELRKTEAQIAELSARKKAMTAQGMPTGELSEKLGDLLSRQAELRLITKGIIKPEIRNRAIVVDEKDLHTGVPGVDRVMRHVAANPELVAYKLQSSAYKFSWALIPISLPFIWMLFMFRRNVGMYDHAVFATYSLSAMTLMVVMLSIVAAVGAPAWAIWTVLLIFPPWHMYRQLKGAYRLGRFSATWRTIALVVSAYTSALIFFLFLAMMEASSSFG